MEPFNRGVWAFNRGLLVGLIEPSSRVYQTLVPRPARKSIQHFSHNVLYPGRLINETLQGRWKDAGDESVRFLTNSTVGVAGFFDVATKWNLPRPEADFGQTFKSWGWRPSTYVMLPLLGPSDDCSATGTLFDEATEPWNYVGVYRRISYGTTYNRISERSGEAARLVRSEADPYSFTHLAWSYLSKSESPDWTVRGPRDAASLQTLGVAAIRTKDPAFVRHGSESSVKIPGTGKRLSYNVWLQKERAPLVYVTPGLGSHRLSTTTLSVAEHLFRSGFSVVTVTSVFHPEFMENASTAALPAYPPTDSGDLLAAITAVDQSLQGKHPERLGKRAFVGCSMGGYQALYLAAHEVKQAPGMVKFDRYVGINTPISLHHGAECVDRFHDAPLAWPAEERQMRVNNAVHKVGALAALPPQSLAAPPFDAVESRFLIGANFRLTLRDIVFSSQSRENLGILQSPISKWRRDPAYQEIMDFSFKDYVRLFALPYLASKGVSAAEFQRQVTLRSFTTPLRRQSKARVITNRNDFLLAPGDLAWLRSTLGSKHLKVFPDGGHLGNLATPPVQDALVGFLEDLK